MTDIARFTLERSARYPYDSPDSFWLSDDYVAPEKPKDWAHAAARGVMYDLKDRKGIKWELEKIDEDVRAEIVQSLAEIIRAAAEIGRAM